MKEINYKVLLINIILFNFINNNYLNSNITCSKHFHCNDCIIKDIIHNNICEYKHLYCLNNKKQIVFFNENLKSNYVNYFYSISEIKKICGKKNILINEAISEKIIEFGYKYFSNRNSICCYYEIKNNLDNNSDIYLSIISNKQEKKIFGLYTF